MFCNLSNLKIIFYSKRLTSVPLLNHQKSPLISVNFRFEAVWSNWNNNWSIRHTIVSLECIKIYNYCTPRAYMTQNMLGMTLDFWDLFDFTVIMQVFSSLKKSEFLSISSILFKSVAETYKKTAKANLSKFGPKQLWILTLFIWGCWGCLRSKNFKWLIRNKFPLLRTTPSLIKILII